MSEIMAEGFIAVPPVAVGSTLVMGYSLSEWVLILTLIYTIFAIIRTAPAVYEVVSTGVKRVWQKVQPQKKQ